MISEGRDDTSLKKRAVPKIYELLRRQLKGNKEIECPLTHCQDMSFTGLLDYMGDMDHYKVHVCVL